MEKALMMSVGNWGQRTFSAKKSSFLRTRIFYSNPKGLVCNQSAKRIVCNRPLGRMALLLIFGTRESNNYNIWLTLKKIRHPVSAIQSLKGIKTSCELTECLLKVYAKPIQKVKKIRKYFFGSAEIGAIMTADFAESAKEDGVDYGIRSCVT